jgi:hypothetical protein
VNGAGVGPSLQESCTNQSCGFTRILSLAAGDVVSVVNSGGSTSSTGAGSGITIVQIA